MIGRFFGRLGRFFKGHAFILLVAFILAIGSVVYSLPATWNKAAQFVESQSFAKDWRIPRLDEKSFRLGLDLQGGTHLTYEADVAKAEGITPAEAMDAVRDVIERRVNIFGVAEPLVQVNHVGDSWRLVVELAGVQNVSEAIKMIGETPFLDFRTERTAEETQKILDGRQANDPAALSQDPYFSSTTLNGSFLNRTNVQFDPNTYEPTVTLEFNSEGATIFEQMTKEFLGKRIAIYLDGAPISAPTVQSIITGGQAVITGNFTVEEAKTLAQRMNAGALPVPITLISQDTVGASLGLSSLRDSLTAGLWGLLAVAVFMVIYYRLSGLLAIVALLIYGAFTLALFRLLGVTMTLSGIAGFILSIGMAVDANILIFERMKEELRAGNPLEAAIRYGVKRAWSSIYDGNVTTLISALILWTFTTSFIKGFAITLMIGILVSMFTAVVLTRYMLELAAQTPLRRWPWLFKPIL